MNRQSRARAKRLLLSTSVLALVAGTMSEAQAVPVCTTLTATTNTTTLVCVSLTSGTVTGNYTNATTGIIGEAVAGDRFGILITGGGTLSGTITNNGLVQ